MNKLSISSNTRHEISLNQTYCDSHESEDEDLILRKCIESAINLYNSNKWAKEQSPKTLQTNQNVWPNFCDEIKVQRNKSRNDDQNKRFFGRQTHFELLECNSFLS
jgi:hypothetical protein